MMHWFFLIFLFIASSETSAQTSRIELVEVRCPSVLGVGQDTGIPFCDIQVQQNPELGVLVVLPPHRDEAILSFDLHNRHTYSETEERSGRAYTKYLASIAVATMDGEVLARGVVLSEFRGVVDLIDRVKGGFGLNGLKAIAPIGHERISLTVPSSVNIVSIVGQSLEVVRLNDRDIFRSIDRPIAVLSDANFEYRPR